MISLIYAKIKSSWVKNILQYIDEGYAFSLYEFDIS